MQTTENICLVDAFTVVVFGLPIFVGTAVEKAVEHESVYCSPEAKGF